MGEKLLLLGRSIQTPVDNKERHVVVTPGLPSKDFILSAKCRIVNVGDRISMSAADLSGDSGGTYTWSTTSNKIRLVNTTGATVAIEANTTPSSGRDSETITVVRTSPDGSQKTKTVSLTVARVTFLAAATQNYGYDDFDTPLDRTDDHVSIKSDSDTVVTVKIDGGALGTDFDFVFDDGAVCMADPPPETAEFALRLRAKTWQRKATLLRVKARCPSAAEFAKIHVHVYSEKVVKVLVAKVADSKSAATALQFATADYAAHQGIANGKLKEAVVKFEIVNFNAQNSVTDVAFDSGMTGALTFDINNNGGLQFDMINRAITKTSRDQYRVVIVRRLRSFYYLDIPARKGETTLTVRGSNVFASKMRLGVGPTMEIVEVIDNSGNVGRLASPLQFDHSRGEGLEFPAAAWSCDPIIIAEGNTPLSETKWTILHEVGHSALELQDIVDPADFMHFNQSNTDYRLRYCPRDSKYDLGAKENQWETIPRPLPNPPAK